eukprot:GHRR01020219.1.p1 GENE.GHRR01020219.1~~GHRR01020219.1.p1  ORF type:complete len:184 (-),score=45.83 GHRR01020219.1:114-665(-)
MRVRLAHISNHCPTLTAALAAGVDITALAAAQATLPDAHTARSTAHSCCIILSLLLTVQQSDHHCRDVVHHAVLLIQPALVGLIYQRPATLLWCVASCHHFNCLLAADELPHTIRCQDQQLVRGGQVHCDVLRLRGHTNTGTTIQRTRGVSRMHGLHGCVGRSTGAAAAKGACPSRCFAVVQQ